MERIDDPSNITLPQAPLATVSPGAFRRPSVLAGDQGTILTGDWANDVQETIIDPILAAGITLAKGDETQLTAAINFLADAVADGLIAAHNSILSSEIIAGHLELANSVEVAAQSEAAKAISPANLASAFVGVSAVPGYIILPGGLTFQWGSTLINNTFDVLVNLPIPFPTAHLIAFASSYFPNASETQNDAGAEPSGLAQIRLGTAQVNRTVHWLSIGQ